MSKAVYNPKEWTKCPDDCAYCHDPFFGHPYPHPTQKRLRHYNKSNKGIKSKQNNSLAGKLN